jgi:hypothetical protein
MNTTTEKIERILTGCFCRTRGLRYDYNFLKFLPISAKKLCFSPKPLLWSNFCKNYLQFEQKRHCFTKKFVEDIFKLITSVPARVCLLATTAKVSPTIRQCPPVSLKNMLLKHFWRISDFFSDNKNVGRAEQCMFTNPSRHDSAKKQQLFFSSVASDALSSKLQVSENRKKVGWLSSLFVI